jgi:hypothetical protein
MALIINPHIGGGLLRRSLCDSSSYNNAKAPHSQPVRFNLTDNGDDDCNVNDDDLEFYSDDASSGVLGGTVVPGTQITPYNNITNPAWREAAGRSILPSDVSRINPDPKMWISQSMLDNLGILHLHKFQIRAIHNIACQRDQLVYLIMKMGLDNSAILLTVGLQQMVVTLLTVHLVGLGSNQVNNSLNEDNFIESYHLDEH